MATLAPALLGNPRFASDRVAVDLVLALTGETGQTPAGYPYLNAAGFARIRDHVPLLFSQGMRAYRLLDAVESEAYLVGASGPERDSFNRALRVVRTMLRTACVTAPPDLWLLRYVLGAYKECGLIDRLLDGERIDPMKCRNESGGTYPPKELVADLGLLLSRGYLYESQGEVFAARHPRAVSVLRGTTALTTDMVTSVWRTLFGGGTIDQETADAYLEACWCCPNQAVDGHRGWLASLEEIEIGWRILPIVLALRVTGVGAAFIEQDQYDISSINPSHGSLVRAAFNVLAVAGAVDRMEDGVYCATPLGRRMFERGPGPFGIIEAYQPYMAALVPMLRSEMPRVWVERGANVAASQDANRKTFREANDALDRFCAQTGFHYSVFIEHALGRGEAVRQRVERSTIPLTYVGADLEDAAIASAKEAQSQGHLPSDMLFVSNADIGNPQTLLRALDAAGIQSQGAVMIVGNGFHEVRGRSDAEMIDVFR